MPLIENLPHDVDDSRPVNSGVRQLFVMYAGHSPDVEAEITFLYIEEIGGGGPVYSGYRPLFFYGGENHIIIIEFIGKELVGPGDTVTAHLHLLHPELLDTRLKEGERFELREGSTVAKGVITRILDLLKNAASNRSGAA